MKKLFVISIIFIVFISSAVAENIYFTWDFNPANELVGTYRIEYQKFPGITNWTFLTSIPGTTNVALVKGVQGGYTYKFRIFAVNALGIGTNLSNIIDIPTNKPSAVLNYNLK